MEDVLYVPGTWETDENVKLLYTLYRYVTYDHFILNRFSLLICLLISVDWKQETDCNVGHM